jgi:hypothetical protein
LDGSKVSSDSGSGGGGSITGFDLCAILALAAFAWFCGRGRYGGRGRSAGDTRKGFVIKSLEVVARDGIEPQHAHIRYVTSGLAGSANHSRSRA